MRDALRDAAVQMQDGTAIVMGHRSHATLAVEGGRFLGHESVDVDAVLGDAYEARLFDGTGTEWRVITPPLRTVRIEAPPDARRTEVLLAGIPTRADEEERWWTLRDGRTRDHHVPASPLPTVERGGFVARAAARLRRRPDPPPTQVDRLRYVLAEVSETDVHGNVGVVDHVLLAITWESLPANDQKAR